MKLNFIVCLVNDTVVTFWLMLWWDYWLFHNISNCSMAFYLAAPIWHSHIFNNANDENFQLDIWKTDEWAMLVSELSWPAETVLIPEWWQVALRRILPLRQPDVSLCHFLTISSKRQSQAQCQRQWNLFPSAAVSFGCLHKKKKKKAFSSYRCF